MNLMTVDGYHAKIEFNEETDQFRGKFWGFLEGQTSMDQIPKNFEASLKSHWTFSSRSVKREESRRTGAFQANSTYGFHLNFMRNWQ